MKNWQQKWQSQALVLLCLTLAGCSLPTEARDSKTSDGDFEAKVLQVIRDNPQVVLESLQKYQQQQREKQQEARQSFIQEMRTNPKSVIGASPATGSQEQKIVLLMFSDFQCPYCATAHTTLEQFMAKHKEQVTLVYKHLPLTNIHSEALNAAKASWAAGQQGKFWDFHDALFTNQDKLGEQLYVDTAKALKLDLAKFNQDRQSESATEAIQKDVEMAQKLGITGTPFLIMNGEAFSGAVGTADLEAALDRIKSQ
jgi:protein-disulfide isomerase